MNRFLILVSLLVLANCSSQLSRPNSPTEDILLPVNRFFNAMRQADGATIDSLLHPNLLLGTIYQRQDSTFFKVGETRSALIDAIGRPRQDRWDEQIYNTTVLVDGPMAVVWAPYEFYRNSEFSHCGVNVFTLLKEGDVWKIVSVTDTRRRNDCVPRS